MVGSYLCLDCNSGVIVNANFTGEAFIDSGFMPTSSGLVSEQARFCKSSDDIASAHPEHALRCDPDADSFWKITLDIRAC